MRITPLLSRGFIGRSLDELTRMSRIVLTSENLKVPTAPFVLKTFHDPESVKECKIMSDADIGGFSQANLDWVPPVAVSEASSSSPTTNARGHVRFHGNISVELPPDRPEIQRTGYAAWRTLDRKPTIFGRSLWDIDPYAYLAMRIKSDGRRYFVNLQTESLVPTDIHQHRLYARRPGEWETVMIDWNEFVRTNHGTVVEPQSEMLRQSVKTVGIGLIDRVPGKFELFIERIWATNGLSEQDLAEDGRLQEGESNLKHTEKIKWGALRKTGHPT